MEYIIETIKMQDSMNKLFALLPKASYYSVV